jgi:hypothetical protein
MRSPALQLAAATGAFLLLTIFDVRAGAGVEEPGAPTGTAMRAAQANALADKYCVVCHRGATPGGGLTLEGFDIARVDPVIPRMMRIKIEIDGALGAAGVPEPDAATTQAFLGALSAAGSRPEPPAWTVTLEQDPGHGYTQVTARSVQRVSGSSQSLYELTVTCTGASKKPSMHVAALSEAAGGQRIDRVIARKHDGTVPVDYVVDGVQRTDWWLPGERANTLDAPTPMPIADRSLTISGVFPDEAVSFPFAELSPTIRRQLSFCSPRP